MISFYNLFFPVFFELPTFIVELNNQKQEPLIEISFRDFIVCYDKHHVYETKIKVCVFFSIVK
jgi:hypothetical protein